MAVRKAAIGVLLCLWAGLVVVLGATLMAGHLLTLPAPAPAKIAPALVALGPHRYLAVHVISAECGCSQKVADRLLLRGPLPPYTEVVLLVGEDAERTASLRARGFDVRTVTAAELGARYDLRAAPLLVVVRPSGEAAYVGGYSDRKQSSFRGDEVLASVVAGRAPPDLPVFGCAVSDELRRSLDPLGLR